MKPNDPSNNLDDMDYTDEELLDQDLGDDLGDDLGEYDENWDDSAEQAAPAKAQKKKSSLFTIIVIGAAVLIGGGILLSIGGKSANDSSAPVEINPPSTEASAIPADPNNLAALQDGAAVPSVPVSEDTVAPPAQGFMNDPTQLDQGGAYPSLPDSPSMTGFADTTPAPAADPITPAELPVPQNLPNIDQIKKAAAPVEAPAELTAVQTPATLPEIVPPVAAPVSTQTDATLQSKLDQVINRIDSLEKKISQTPATTNSGEIASLRIAVERLENKVAQLSDTPVVRSAPASSYSDDSKVVVKKSVPKKKAAPKSSASSAKWELRSARPGEAMVGKAGQAELKTIRVGDSVVGIGQIQSISQSGGQWIVQGTSGSIKQ